MSWLNRVEGIRVSRIFSVFFLATVVTNSYYLHLHCIEPALFSNNLYDYGHMYKFPAIA